MKPVYCSACSQQWKMTLPNKPRPISRRWGKGRKNYAAIGSRMVLSFPSEKISEDIYFLAGGTRPLWNLATISRERVERADPCRSSTSLHICNSKCWHLRWIKTMRDCSYLTPLARRNGMACRVEYIWISVWGSHINSLFFFIYTSSKHV